MGTDDGLIHVTVNAGTTWKDVTPPDLVPWAKVSMLEASHFDPLGRLRGDQHHPPRRPPPPHLSHPRRRTTWTAITAGLPDGATINTIKEDPKRKGLLFAGSETQVYVSFDDGESMAVAAPEHAGDVDSRSGHQG